MASIKTDPKIILENEIEVESSNSAKNTDLTVTTSENGKHWQPQSAQSRLIEAMGTGKKKKLQSEKSIVFSSFMHFMWSVEEEKKRNFFRLWNWRNWEIG